MNSDEAAVFVKQVETHFRREYLPVQRQSIVQILTSLSSELASRVQIRATEGKFLPSLTRWREVENYITGNTGPDKQTPAPDNIASQEIVSFYRRCMIVIGQLRPELRRAFVKRYEQFEWPHEDPEMINALEQAEKIPVEQFSCSWMSSKKVEPKASLA